MFSRQKKIKDESKIREATLSAVICGEKEIKNLDDGISDISSIAYAVSAACSREYQNVLEAICQYGLDNDEQCRMFKNLRSTRDKKIEFFIERALAYRKSKQ